MAPDTNNAPASASAFGPDGLTEADRAVIRGAVARYPEIERVTLFGSRAMGTFGRGSDVDLALEGRTLTPATAASLAADLDESALPYRVDVLVRDNRLDAEVEQHIRRHGRPFEWRVSTWGEEISLEYGKGLRGYADAAGRVPVFGTNGPVGWTDEPLANGPGVILGRKGAYRGVHYSPDPFFVIDTAYYARAKSPLNMRWLYYAMIFHQLGEIDDGSPIPSTTRAAVYPRELLVPPLEEQEAIAATLGTLDDKIEQNRRAAQVLEALARATFKAWFVDFEPVKAKAAGAPDFPGMPHTAFAALPDRLTSSQVGPAPQGWEVSNIGKIAQRIAMGPFGSDIKTENFVPDGVPVIRGGNLADGFVDRDFVFLREAKADQLSNANAFPGDIVLTHRGTLGQVGLIPSKARYKRYVVSQSQMLIRPNAATLPSHFLYLFLTSPVGQHELLANRSQTGVPAISRPTTSLKAISVLVPQRPVVDAFEHFASTLFAARVAAEDESRRLAALRDYLLPRLLDGRVRVPAPQPG